jgi:hypothetical protein
VRARTGPRRATAADVDADGNRDLVVTMHDELLVLLGRGDGSFESERFTRSTERTRDALVGDVDGDDVPDLVTLDDGFGVPTSLSAYRGDGSGTFAGRALTPVEANVNSVFLAQVDGDGLIDVVLEYFEQTSSVVASAATVAAVAGAAAAFQLDASNRVAVLNGSGDGLFGPPRVVADLRSSDIAGGDVDGDGNFDFVALVRDPNGIDVYLGDGETGFERAGGFGIGSGAAGDLFLLDLDGDGDLDLASLDFSRDRVSFWLGNGDGTFGRGHALTVEGPSEIVAADFDADGAGDFAILSPYAESFSLFFGDGRGAFGAPVLVPSEQAAARRAPVAADFDRDGAVDLAYVGVSQRYDHLEQVSILPGDGRGGFRARISLPANADNSRFQAVIDLLALDLDGSGTLDLTLAREGDRENQTTFLADPGNCMLP